MTGDGDLRLGTSHPLETLVDHGGRGVFETTGVAAARIARRPDGSLCPQGCVFWGSSARRRRADKASTMSPAPLLARPTTRFENIRLTNHRTTMAETSNIIMKQIVLFIISGLSRFNLLLVFYVKNLLQ